MMEDRRTDEIINKFSSLPCKTDRFHVSVGFFANRSQKTSRCVRKLVTHQVAPHVPLFSSYHILTPSVIYYWTDAINESIRLFIKVNAWDQVVLCIKARGSCIRRMTVIKKRVSRQKYYDNSSKNIRLEQIKIFQLYSSYICCKVTWNLLLNIATSTTKKSCKHCFSF